MEGITYMVVHALVVTMLLSGNPIGHTHTLFSSKSACSKALTNTDVTYSSKDVTITRECQEVTVKEAITQ